MSLRRFSLVVLTLLFITSATSAGPVVFWAPDRAAHGDVVLLYGGGLVKAERVLAWQVPNGDPGQPPGMPLSAPDKATGAPSIQPCENSVKFVLPEALKPGVFGIQVVAGVERSMPLLLNRPETWFAQPTFLRPGLDVNQFPPGAEIQIVGKNFAVRGDSNPRRALLCAPEPAVQRYL